MIRYVASGAKLTAESIWAAASDTLMIILPMCFAEAMKRKPSCTSFDVKTRIGSGFRAPSATLSMMVRSDSPVPAGSSAATLSIGRI